MTDEQRYALFEELTRLNPELSGQVWDFLAELNPEFVRNSLKSFRTIGLRRLVNTMPQPDIYADTVRLRSPVNDRPNRNWLRRIEEEEALVREAINEDPDSGDNAKFREQLRAFTDLKTRFPVV